ncbi:MAG: PEP-CTERM sorting domain-containing protein [Planctomycetia bacterium]|nr:PEP-CTERM sorting domain-containing protein [Planctomycetia bacterium]
MCQRFVVKTMAFLVAWGMAVGTNAAVVTVGKTGNWSDATTWTGGVVPGAGDTVVWGGEYVVSATDAELRSVSGITLTGGYGAYGGSVGTLKSQTITDPSRLTLTSGHLYVDTVGTAESPVTLTNSGTRVFSYENRANITIHGDYVSTKNGLIILNGGSDASNVSHLTAKNIKVEGGSLYIYNYDAASYGGVKGDTFTLDRGAKVAVFSPYKRDEDPTKKASFAINSTTANISGSLGESSPTGFLDILSVASNGYTSTVNFSGTACVQELSVGAQGIAVFHQTGGSIRILNPDRGFFIPASGVGSGTYTMSGGTLNTTNMFLNYGKSFVQQTQGTIDVSGTLTLGTSSNLQTGRTTLYEMKGGTLSAKNIAGASTLLKLAGGTVQTDHVTGNLFNDGAEISPFTATEGITFTGDYAQTAGSIHANGLTAKNARLSGGEFSIDLSEGDSFSRFTGDLFLGENLILSVRDDWMDTGVSYLLTAATMSGTSFAEIFSKSMAAGAIANYWTYSPHEDGYRIHLNASAIPEPSSLWLMLIGMVGFFRKREFFQRKDG